MECMKFSEEQIRGLVELKDELAEKIRKCDEEIEKLQRNISVLDSILKQSSFAKASDLTVDTKKQAVSIPITKNSDGTTIANVFVSDDKVSIVLEDNIIINPETPPLKTFFVDRIIGEMKKKDNQEAENGTINKDDIIDCMIKNNGSALREIIIKNYRQKERVDEIITTTTWSLRKMLENSE